MSYDKVFNEIENVYGKEVNEFDRDRIALRKARIKLRATFNRMKALENLMNNLSEESTGNRFVGVEVYRGFNA